MKNKFKALLAAFVGLFAFSAVAVGLNAMSLSNDSKTASWSTSDMKGCLNGSKGTYSGSKFTEAGTFVIKSKCLLIPVVSENSEGTLSIVAQGNNSDRFVYLMNGDGSASETTKTVMSKTSTDIKFTSANVIKEAGKYYVGLTAVNSSGTATDYKISTISLKLSSDETYATQVSISYYLKGESSSFETQKIDSGSTLNASAVLWGYNITGYFSDAECSISWDSNSTISADTNVYCTYETWVINDANALDFALMEKGYNTFGDPAFTSKTPLTGTIYSVLPGGTCFYPSTVEIDSSTKTKAAIKTGGKLNNNQNGLEFTASSAGTLTIYAKNGSSSEVKIALFKDCDTNNPISEVTPTSTVTKYELSVPEAGTYQLGSAEGSVYFYYASFTPSVNLNYQVNEEYTDSKGVTVAAGSQIRFVGTINCLTAETLADATATLKLTLGEKAANVEITSVYTSVAIDAVLTFEEATNVYYVVFIISGLNKVEAGQVLTAQLDVTVGGTTYSSVVKTHTIA